MIWLIITDQKLIGIQLSTEQYHEHTFDNSEMDTLRIINPSWLHALLVQWFGNTLHALAIALHSTSIYEQYNATTVPAGFIVNTCQLSPHVSYTAGIPSGIFMQYQCIMHTLNLKIRLLTTLTLLQNTKQPIPTLPLSSEKKVLNQDPKILIDNCRALSKQYGYIA